jgi:DNA-binding FadR family transcriptional regulator
MTLMTFTPPSKRRLADVLYGQLLEQITSGVLVPGSKLPTEIDMCKAFAVSRPVVREALMRLQADGLVESRRGSGTYLLHAPSAEINRFIEPADFSRYLRALEVRIALEPEAARLAARRRQPEDLSRLNNDCRELELAIKAGAPARKYDLAFHMSIAHATGNELFAHQLRGLDAELEGFMSVSLGLTGLGSAERKGVVLQEHRQIVDAIGSGDSELAATYMRYHLSQARRRLTDVKSQP